VVNAAEERLRLGLQLYKVQRGIYLLDLVLLKGDAFTFLNSCARIIAELKVPAVAASGAAAGAGAGSAAAGPAGAATVAAALAGAVHVSAGAVSSSMVSGGAASMVSGGGTSAGGDSVLGRGGAGGGSAGPGGVLPPPAPSYGHGGHTHPDAMDTST
jgi:hypothetical protein